MSLFDYVFFDCLEVMPSRVKYTSEK
uniref:Uncharacterized protein n=1 Tax=Lepeophtheirus salmonis TaxID=72036 RepID=A0A0K2SYA3_LEPSM